MKKFLLLSIIIVLTIAFTACESKESTTIRFAVPRNDQHALAIIASEKGFFEEQGLYVRVTYMPTGVECLHALISNSADIASTMDVMIANYGYSGNKDISVVAAINNTLSTCIIARKSAGIENPEDLRGKRLAMSPGTSSEIYVLKFLDKYNLSDNVEIIKMQTNAITSAIITESVDAIAAFGPFFYNAQKSLGEDAVLFQGVYAFDALLAVNNDYIINNRGNVIKFIKAMEETATFVKNNESEAQEIVARVVNLDIEAVKEIWKLHDFTFGLGIENLERIIDIGEYYKTDEANRGKPFPDYSAYFDYSLMEELR